LKRINLLLLEPSSFRGRRFQSSLALLTKTQWFIIVLGYFSAGSAFIVYKWFNFSRKKHKALKPEIINLLEKYEGVSAEIYEQSIDKMDLIKKLDDHSNEQRLMEWLRIKRRILGGEHYQLPLKSTEFKERLMMHGMWWPLSLASMFFTNFLSDLWSAIVETMSSF